MLDMSPKAQEEKQKTDKELHPTKKLKCNKRIIRVRRANLWNGGNNCKVYI